MTLKEIITDLESIDDSLTICAEKGAAWSDFSIAELHASHLAANQFPLPYFLEVSVAKSVISAWSFARGGRIPNLKEKCEAIIYYAENDAYLLPE